MHNSLLKILVIKSVIKPQKTLYYMTLNFRAQIDFSNSEKIRILAHRIYLSAKNSNIFAFRNFREMKYFWSLLRLDSTL